MPLPNAKSSQARVWFQKYLTDLMSAKRLLGTPPLIEPALFFTQQVVEKALKGFLISNEKTIDKTHDLGRIAIEVLKVDPSLEALLRRATRLSPFAVIFRYPSDDFATSKPTMEEALESIALAEEVYLEVLKRVPKDQCP